MNIQKSANWIFTGNYLYFTSLILVVFLILSIFCTLDEQSYNWFFSTDTLYLPSIYKDLFTDGGTLDGWHFNPAPNFFPDMLVYFLLMYLTGSFLLSTAFFAVIQYIIIIVLFRSILLQIMQKEMVTRIVIFSNMLLAMYFVKTMLDHDLSLSFYLLINSYHTSIFTMALLSYLLFILYLKNGMRVFLVFLVIISFLGVLSDKLVFMSITVPIMGMSLFYKKSPYDKRRLLVAAGLVFLSSVLGIVFFNILKNLRIIHFGTPFKMFAFNDMFTSGQLFLKDTLYYFSSFHLNSIILFLSIFSIIIGIIITVFNIIQKKKFTNWSFYIMFSTIFSITVIGAAIINGLYVSLDCFRYNIYPYYLGALNFPLFLIRSKLWFNRLSVIVVPVLMVFYFILIVNGFSLTGFKAYSEYYPVEVKSIDEIARKEGFLKGVGNYWDAKFINMFSKQNVRVYAVLGGLQKYYHVANEHWYNADTAIFNFIIDKEMDHLVIKKIFHLDTLMYIHNSPDIIMVPEFIYVGTSWEPVLLDSDIAPD